MNTHAAHHAKRNQQEINHFAAVGYIPLVNFLILFAHRKDRFISEHSVNGILLSIYFLLAYFLIPDFGIYIALIFLAGAVSGFIYASAGRRFELPLIADFVKWTAKRF